MTFVNRPLTIRGTDWPVQWTEKAIFTISMSLFFDMIYMVLTRKTGNGNWLLERICPFSIPEK